MPRPRIILIALLLFASGVVHAQTPTINSQLTTPVINEDGSVTLNIAMLDINYNGANPAEFSLVVHPGSNYTASGTVVSPISHYYGALSLEVVLTNGIVTSLPFNFAVTVNPINDPPTLDAIGNVTFDKNAPEQLIPLTGITAGLLETQVLAVSASSSNPSLFSSIAITYTSPNTTGTLRLTPAANATGSATITVTVTDNGSNVAPNANHYARTFNLTVNNVNYTPTFDPISDVTINEDAALQQITITGISPGLGEAGSQTVVLSATSSNTTLLPDANISFNYNGTASAGTIRFTAASNRFGSTTITVTALDSQGAQFTRTFTVTVDPINDPPALDAIANVTVNKNGPEQLIPLTGISAGPFESQVITIAASSSNAILIGSMSVVYASPDATGTLRITPAANASGTATITVTATDNGSNAAPNVNTFSRTFTLTVNNVNYPPTFDVINPITVDEDAGTQVISVTGISPGTGEAGSQTVAITASSSNTTLIPAANISVTYNGSSSTGTISFTPATNRFGTATLTVVATDAQGADFSRTVSVIVNAINDTPTLNPINNVSVNKNSPEQPVLITGINAGPFESQVLTVTTTTDHPELFSNLTVSYSSPNPSGAILVTPAPNASGTAIITVTVTDNGSNVAPNVNTVSRSFSFTINDLNYPPAFNAISGVTMNEDGGEQEVTISGISPGFNEAGSQTVMLTASSSNTTLLPDASFVITYDGTSPTASLKFAPGANRSGTAIVTARATDSQGAEFSRTFSVTVNPINDAPTLDALNNITIAKNATEQLISLTGIAAGPFETQVIAISATSSVPALFSNISVDYNSPETTGTLRVTPAPNISGTAVITVIVTDNGSNTPPNVNNLTRTLSFTINDVNYPPTFDPIDPIVVDEDVPSQTITITGISPGLAEAGTQTVQLTATSSNTTLVPVSNIQITYNGTAATALMKITPSSNRWGTATITLRGVDSGGAEFSRTFSVTVNPINDPPTIDIISPITVDADLPLQSIPLTGITGGPFESQTLTLVATSDKPELFESLEVHYQNPQTTGTLSYKTKPFLFGTASITIRVTDNGPDSAPNVNYFVRTFVLTITPVNHAPTFVSQPVTTAIVGHMYEYSVQTQDVDPGNVLALTAITKPAWLALEPFGNGNATLRGIPPVGAGGSSTIRLEIRDDQNAVGIQEFVLRINTRPLLTSFPILLDEDIPVSIPVSKFVESFADADADPLSAIMIVTLPKHGRVTLGDRDIGANQEIAAGSFQEIMYKPNLDYNGKDTLTWNASDGSLYASKAASVFFEITSKNDAPVITKLETTPLELTVGQGPTLITNEFEIIDVDNTTLEGVDVGFRNLGTSTYLIGTDVLIYNNQATPAVSGTFNPQSGVLSLRGNATISDYIAAVRSIRYDFVTNLFLSESLTKTIYFSATDGTAFSVVREREISITDSFEDLTIPNAFSPNDDGTNDTWHISNMERYPNTSVTVYNTHGLVVYASRDAINDWDGRLGNLTLPSNTYYYVIDLNLPGRKRTYQGPITIVKR